MRLIAVRRNLAFNGFQVIKRSFKKTAHLWHNIEKDDENMKTSVNFITHPKEHASKQRLTFVTRYGPKGFVVQGSRVVGSLVILPGLLLHWKLSSWRGVCIHLHELKHFDHEIMQGDKEVNSSEEITPESLEVFTILDPALVIGTGDRVVRLDKTVHEAMRNKGIALEIQDTANACATYNFLLDEGRITGAALIPPSHLPS